MTTTSLGILDGYIGEIFVDASFWVALMNVRDERYDRAKITWDFIISKDLQPVTTNWTLYEAVTHLNGRVVARHDRALELLELANLTTIVEDASIFEHTAIEVFKTHPDRRWSVVDCANFVCIRERQNRFALSYDVRDFEQAQYEFGFTLLGYIQF